MKYLPDLVLEELVSLSGHEIYPLFLTCRHYYEKVAIDILEITVDGGRVKFCPSKLFPSDIIYFQVSNQYHQEISNTCKTIIDLSSYPYNRPSYLTLKYWYLLSSGINSRYMGKLIKKEVKKNGAPFIPYIRKIKTIYHIDE